MSRSKNSERMIPIMPPFLEEEKIPLDRSKGTTKFGGTACEHAMMMFLLSQRINCAEPLVDDGVDLLVEKGGTYQRAQVKKVVYQNKLDTGILERTGVEKHWENFTFSFQGSSQSVPHLKNGRRQHTIEEIDVFYHVLFTCYRQLIWEIPSSIIPLRDDGKTFVQCVTGVLTRNNWKRKPAAIDLNKHLIYSRYDPIIFEHYPDFFEKKSSLEPFFN